MRYNLDEVREARGGRSEGTHWVEVLAVDDKPAQSGTPMISLTLVEPNSDGQVVCFDRIMMGGKGLGISKQKLKALGINLDDESFDSQDLVGRRFYVALVFGKPNKDGKIYLEVNIRAPGSKCGYFPEDSPPDAGVVSDAETAADDMPF